MEYWAENSGEYGLTEFLVREGAEVTIAYTDTIPDYIKRLEQEEHQKIKIGKPKTARRDFY